MEEKVAGGRCTREKGDALLEGINGDGTNISSLVTLVPRFVKYFDVLERMFDEKLPPVIKIRSTK